MSHQIEKVYSQPALNAESFQRLLAAAYILQSHSDRTAAFPIAVSEKKPFAVGAILQKRTPAFRPSLIIQPSSTRGSVIRRSVIKKSAAMRWASTMPGLTGPMLWKSAEALAIATVFCVMMAMSIHHLLAYPGRASSSTVLPTREAGQLAGTTPQLLLSSVLASQPDSTRKSRQSHDDLDEAAADIDDGDLVIHYRPLLVNPRSVNLPGPIAKGISMQAARRVTARVIQYGDDVTMWSSASSEPSLDLRNIR